MTKYHGKGYQLSTLRNPVVTWTSATETRIATLSRSIACLIDLIGGKRNWFGIDRPELDQQQRDGRDAGRDMDALSEPVAPDRLRRLGQPRPRLVLVMAEQSGHEEHRDRDAEHVSPTLAVTAVDLSVLLNLGHQRGRC